MTTPLAPDTPDASTFGGPYRDFDNIEDPETDVGSDALNKLITQVVQLSHTAPRAWVRVAAGAAPTLTDHDAVWGNTAGVAPTLARTGTGVYTVTWAATYNDLQATPESHAVNFRAALPAPKSASARFLHYDLTSSRVVTVKSFDAAGSPADVDEFTLTVW
jgi:hypothetical protein